MIQARSGLEDRLFHREHPSAGPTTDAGGSTPKAISEIELIPANYFASLDLSAVFYRRAPLEVDLGCGDGAFLVALAEKFPERNFLGLERLRGRVRSACGRAARRKVQNTRVLLVETSYAVEYLLPPASTEVAHLLFPDPWPKKRHQRRRIVTQNFIDALYRVLVPGGRLYIATDQQDYFEAICALVSASAFAEESVEWNETFPPTTFEKRFRARGLPIYRLLLRKVA